MKIQSLILMVAFVFTSLSFCGPSAYGSPAATTTGMSVKQFQTFASAIPQLPGDIQAIRLFRTGDSGEMSVVIATYVTPSDKASGWRLFVFSPSASGNGFHMVWKSGKLDYTFTVSWQGALKLFGLTEGDGVVFSGCAPHLCGGTLFSVLLYVPAKRTAFSATFDCGKITYSSGLKSPENRSYKEDLEQLIHTEYQAEGGSASGC